MRENTYFVYILASKRYGTLYVGLTNDLARRMEQHRAQTVRGFTEKYDVHRLVHFEKFGDINEAKYREKQLKWWKRDWKISLIEEHNPLWDALLLY
jgi:putative endonuclease